MNEIEQDCKSLVPIVGKHMLYYFPRQTGAVSQSTILVCSSGRTAGVVWQHGRVLATALLLLLLLLHMQTQNKA